MEVFISHKFEHLLLPNLPVKNSSAVLKDPSRPSISISHDKCKTDVPFFGWKPSLCLKKYTLYTLCGSRKYPHRNTEGGEGIRGPGNSRGEGGWTITITFQAVNFQLSTKIATY